MARSHWAAVIGVMVLGSATAASGDPITIIQDQRAAIALAEPRSGGSVESAQPSDLMKSAAALATAARSGVSTASLSSSYATDPLHWFGTGVADLSFTTPDTGNYSADSRFAVIFEVNSPVSYNFNETFTTSSSLVPLASQVVAANAFGGLNGVGGTSFGFGTPNAFRLGSASGNPTFTGLLSPGIYTFVVGVLARGFADRGPEAGAANARFAFNLDFTPVEPSPTPEPASLLLLGTGLGGLACRKRRRRGR